MSDGDCIEDNESLEQPSPMRVVPSMASDGTQLTDEQVGVIIDEDTKALVSLHKQLKAETARADRAEARVLELEECLRQENERRTKAEAVRRTAI